MVSALPLEGVFFTDPSSALRMPDISPSHYFSQKAKMEYVVVYVYGPNILLVRKKSPHWQAGKLNLPGGKIEKGVTPIDAAARELLEETGFEGINYREMGKIQGSWGRVHVVSCFKHSGRLGGCEDAGLFNASVLQNETLIPNLKVIIPLCQAGVTGWTILQEIGSSYDFTIRTG